MENKTKINRLEIAKMPDGGYTISDPFVAHGSLNPLPLFAASDIGEALTYVRRQFEAKLT